MSTQSTWWYSGLWHLFSRHRTGVVSALRFRYLVMKSLIGLAQALNERYAVTEQIPGSSSTGSVRTCWIACSRLASKAAFSVIAAMAPMHVSAEKNTGRNSYLQLVPPKWIDLISRRRWPAGWRSGTTLRSLWRPRPRLRWTCVAARAAAVADWESQSYERTLVGEDGRSGTNEKRSHAAESCSGGHLGPEDQHDAFRAAGTGVLAHRDSFGRAGSDTQ